MDLAILQDNASSLYRNNINPLLQRCASYMGSLPPRPDPLLPPSPSLVAQRSFQHSESLKWQQDVFHHLLHLICLSREGLATQTEVDGCKRQILSFLQSTHPDGEWPEFTRDKLLFLQDLLYAACITEREYHDAKKILILRLADQGAFIDSEDFIFDSTVTAANEEKPIKTKRLTRTSSSSRRAKTNLVGSDSLRIADKAKADGNVSVKSTPSSPLKQVMGAVSRISKSPNPKSSVGESPLKAEKGSVQARVPHPFDFLRPEHCPERDPPSPYQQPYHPHKPADLCMSKENDKMPSSTFHNDSQDDDQNIADVCNCDSPVKASAVGVDKMDRSNSSPASLLDSGSANKASNNTPSRLKSMISGFIQRKPSVQFDGTGKSPAKGNESEAEEEEEKQPSASKGSKWGLTGLMQKKPVLLSESGKALNRQSSESDSEDDEVMKTPSRGKWGLNMFTKLPKKLQFDQQENVADNDVGKPCLDATSHDDGYPVSTIIVDGSGGKGPDTRRLKKKLNTNGTPSDFFIDKVLGEKIKNELCRIRVEMNNIEPGQTFTDEQIDVIATRLPMDNNELKKFFPQTWCEKYGDVVLAVVQREFKEHVQDMQKLGKTAKTPSPMKQNDENLPGLESPIMQQNRSNKKNHVRRAPDFNKCFTTLDENIASASNTVHSPSPRKPRHSHSPSPIKKKGSGKSTPHAAGRFQRDRLPTEDNLDLNLGEDNSKMPQRLNEYGSHFLRA